MIGTLLTFLAVGLASMIVAGVVLWVVGIVFSVTIGLASFLMFKVAPYLLLGWVVLVYKVFVYPFSFLKKILRLRS